jgi:hypothetical protein
MTKHYLASQLRQRQIARGLVPKAMVDALSDDEIIDCYITCSDCGVKQVEGVDLETAIATTRSASDFFRTCNAMAQHRHEGECR